MLFVSECPKGSGRIKVPGEELGAVGAGGGEREGVRQAEAAVVLHQRPGGSLHLPAQQSVREVSKVTALVGERRWEVTNGDPLVWS